MKGLEKWERICVAVGSLLMVLIIYAWTEHFINEPYQGGQPEGTKEALNKGPQGWGNWSDIWIMRWTGFLTAFTILQLVLWWFSNRIARHALNESKKANNVANRTADETKRSVDAFLRAERGRLMFDHMEWSEFHVGCTIWFKNIGKRAVIVRAFEAQYEPEGTAMPKHAPFNPSLGFYQVVEPDGFFIAGIDDSAVEITYHLPSDEIRERLRSKKGIYIMFQILYEPIQASKLLLQITGHYSPAAEVMKTYIGRVNEGVSDFELPQLTGRPKRDAMQGGTA